MFDYIYDALDKKTKQRFTPADTEIYDISLNPALLNRLLSDNSSMDKDELTNILDINIKTILEMYNINAFTDSIKAAQIFGLFSNPIVVDYVKYYMIECTNPSLNKIITNIYYICLMMHLNDSNNLFINSIIEILRVSNMNDFIQLHQIDMNVDVIYIAILIGMTTHYNEEYIDKYINELYSGGKLKLPAEYIRYIHTIMNM